MENILELTCKKVRWYSGQALSRPVDYLKTRFCQLRTKWWTGLVLICNHTHISSSHQWLMLFSIFRMIAFKHTSWYYKLLNYDVYCIHFILLVIWKSIHSFTYLFIYHWVSRRIAFSRPLLYDWVIKTQYAFQKITAFNLGLIEKNILSTFVVIINLKENSV